MVNKLKKRKIRKNLKDQRKPRNLRKGKKRNLEKAGKKNHKI